MLHDNPFSVSRFHLRKRTVDEGDLRRLMPAIDVIDNRDSQFGRQIAINVFGGITFNRFVGLASPEQYSGAMIEPPGKLHLHVGTAQIGGGKFTVFHVPKDRFAGQMLFPERPDIAVRGADQMPDDVDPAAQQSSLKFQAGR